MQENVIPKETTREKTDTSKKPVKKMAFISAAAAVLLVAIIILAVLSLSSGKGDYIFVEAGSGYYIKGLDGLVFSMDGQIAKTNGEWDSVLISADGSLSALLDDEGNLYVRGKGVSTKVSGDVSVVAVSFYGDTVAYFKDVKNSVGMLYLYHVKSDDSDLIDKEAYTGNFVLSPDGKSVAYIGNCEIDEWYGTVDGDIFLSTGGNNGEKLYSGGIPVAVTDGGNHVFYMKDDSKFYLDDERIANDVRTTFFFNRDNAELFYEKDGATYYYTVKQQESVKVKNSSCYGLLMPDNVAQKQQTWHDYQITMYGTSSLDGVFAEMDDSIFYLSNQGEDAEKIGSASDTKISEDGKGILFLKNGSLYYIKDVGKSTEAKELGDDLEADSFVASSDLKKIYYQNDGEIFFLQDGKGVRVADEADIYIYSDKYKVLFFTCDEELFSATTKAKSKEKVMGGRSEQPWQIMFSGGEAILGFSDDSVTRYYKTTGKDKAELLLEVENDSY